MGGRTTTVHAFNDSRYATELGASIFVPMNRILFNASKEFDLQTVETLITQPKESRFSLGVWDGTSFVFTQASDGSQSWWDMAKLLWKYGLAPVKTQRLMKKVTARFQRMYEKPIFPFGSLDDAVIHVGLLDLTAATGIETLEKESIGVKFSTDVIQASTRVNYAQNLDGIHGLEAMVCMATEGAMAIDGGNWQIFDRMVNKSMADVRLRTNVLDIKETEVGTYSVTVEAAAPGQATPHTETDFDAVIFAAPYQFSDVNIIPPILPPPEEVPYVTLHVTLLASPHRISPGFFGLVHPDDVPEMVLTTLPRAPDLSSQKSAVGPAGFWSVSVLRTIEANGTIQYLYKVFSPKPLTVSWIADLLGFSHDGRTGHHKKEIDDRASSLRAPDVTWLHEKEWHSYPYERPRVTFERIRLRCSPRGCGGGKGIWYTSGIEPFISTMETSALMGMNVAKLILDEWGAEDI